MKQTLGRALSLTTLTLGIAIADEPQKATIEIVSPVLGDEIAAGTEMSVVARIKTPGGPNSETRMLADFVRTDGVFAGQSLLYEPMQSAKGASVVQIPVKFPPASKGGKEYELKVMARSPSAQKILRLRNAGPGRFELAEPETSEK